MVAQGNVGLAFGLVTAAGMATTLGAACVFLGNVCKPRVLAAALSFSAGVMLYVSFVEIFAAKSMSAFIENGSSEGEASRFATFCFFGGIAIVYVLDGLVHLITNLAIWLKKQELKRLPGLKRLLSKHSLNKAGAGSVDTPEPSLHSVSTSAVAAADSDVEAGTVCTSESGKAAPAGLGSTGGATVVEVANPIFGAPTALAPTSLVADCDMEQQAHNEASGSAAAASAGTTARARCTSKLAGKMERALHGVEETLRSQFPSIEPSEGIASEEGAAPTTAVPRDPDVMAILQDDHHQFALMKMGLLTALAIFIHNFPEGLATFVAALADPSLGITIAIAIAIHNIPEGICVALPIYYATGSKWKGFFWGVVSGLSEPIGGLFGYLILFDTSPLCYAIVFGIVGGMMVCISLKELIPTALKYDPDTHIVVGSLFFGMLVMASSLLLFSI